MYVRLEILTDVSLKIMCNLLGENFLLILSQNLGSSSVFLGLINIYKHQILRLQLLNTISVFVRQNYLP
jgi:hypothetical protein